MGLKKNTIYRIKRNKQNFILYLLFSTFVYTEGYWAKYGWELFENVIDARTASLGNATTAYNYEWPTTSLNNPIFSSAPSQRITLSHQSRYAGIFNNDLISFPIKRKDKVLQFNILYEGIGQIPDTRSMLLDWGNDGQFGTNDAGEGNGILDEGERLDADQLRFFSQHQIGVHSSFTNSIQNIPVGIGFKILSYSLDKYFAIGVGIDIGIIKQVKGTSIGIVTRNLPASGLIWDNGTVEGTTPTVSIGVHRPLELTKLPLKLHSMFSFDFSTSNRHLDSQLGFGPFSLDGSFGIEGIIKDKFYIRIGQNEIGNSTGGIGMHWTGFGIDYAFLSSQNNNLGHHHLITLNVEMDWIKEKLIKLQ
tara:strand:- start:1442 stop:2527 length:1086 start_codon:yes stop_codon:yes gene_type:complete